MSQRNRGLDELPPIYVSEPGYDDMGEILTELGIEYGSLSEIDSRKTNDAVVMLNCHSKWKGGVMGTIGKLSSVLGGEGSVEMSWFEQFIREGGSAIVSDFAGEILTEFSSATFDTLTWGKTIDASVEDDELSELLGRDQIPIEFDIGGWYKPSKTPEGIKPLLRNRDTGEVLAYQFSYGEGQIVYTAFHNHEQADEVEKALLQLLVIIPISEATNTSVKDTYTTVVADSGVSEGDTILQEPTTQESEQTEAEIQFLTEEGDNITKYLGIEESIKLGRSDMRGYVSEDDVEYISGTHIEIRRVSKDRFEIRDTDSKNGTKLNERDISDGASYPLEDRSELKLAGRVDVVVRID